MNFIEIKKNQLRNRFFIKTILGKGVVVVVVVEVVVLIAVNRETMKNND